MKRALKTFKKILTDIIPVTFGVLIALFIGNMKQSFDDQKFLKKMYATISKEMETNTEAVSEVLINHYAFIDTINSNIDKEVSIAEILQMNLGKANVKNTGYYSLINAKLELVDFKVISILSTLEENKQSLNLKFDQLRNFIILHLHTKKRAHKETLLLLMMNVIDSEEGMIKILDQYLDWYKNEVSH